MWITVDVERVLRVDRGINVILCERMPGPQTLVLKLKGSEMTDEIQRLRSALESIADWRNVNISGEHELGLRDIIRSIINSAVDALDAPHEPQPACTCSFYAEGHDASCPLSGPWQNCPSTHCERAGECRSPSDCCAPVRS